MQNKHPKNTAKQSKRYAFVAVHRGGSLTKENHRKLMKWARVCAEHVLPLIDKEIDQRLLYALEIAKEWEKDLVPTGVAIKASLGAHAVARQSEDPIYKAVARSIGQAVATAHMADHSLGGAFYAIKAVKLANKNIERERDWQNKKLDELPDELREIIQAMWKMKELDRRL
ncbi:MAG: hypothetical protein Q8M15_08585 [Bacteroidota bacterium]|nr:hypothetical protein [Bacteroidota bacterium]